MNRNLPGLMSGWRSSAIKHGYMETFSINVWQSLSDKEKSNHSLSNCEACYLNYFSAQKAFHLKPLFESKNRGDMTIAAIVKRITENPSAGTREMLSVLNENVASATGQDFNTLVNLHSKQLGFRQSAKENFKENLGMLN